MVARCHNRAGRRVNFSPVRVGLVLSCGRRNTRAKTLIIKAWPQARYEDALAISCLSQDFAFKQRE